MMKHIGCKIVSLLLTLSVVLLSACGQTDDESVSKSTADEATAAVTQTAQAVTQTPTAAAAQSVTQSIKETAAQETTAIDSELQDKLEAIMEEHGFSGVFRVSKNGMVISEGANGLFSAESGEPITLDDRFLIASVSKQFCATCVLLLREEGKLSLDDTLDKYYPEYARAKDITLRQMLTMRSGISDYVSNDGSGFDAYIKYDFGENASEKANHQAVRDWIFSQPPVFEPGEGFFYSDSNYFLLAEIVETVTGKSYGDVLRERIFQPLGMNDTGVAEELAHDARTVPPVTNDPNSPREIYTIGATFGNGGIITTAADMDKWLTSLREYTILPESCIREMTTDYSPESEHYGYGIFVSPDGSLSHEGMADSYATYAYTNPKTGLNLFITTSNAYARFTDFRRFANEVLNEIR